MNAVRCTGWLPARNADGAQCCNNDGADDGSGAGAGAGTSFGSGWQAAQSVANRFVGNWLNTRIAQGHADPRGAWTQTVGSSIGDAIAENYKLREAGASHGQAIRQFFDSPSAAGRYPAPNANGDHTVFGDPRVTQFPSMAGLDGGGSGNFGRYEPPVYGPDEVVAGNGDMRSTKEREESTARARAAGQELRASVMDALWGTAKGLGLMLDRLVREGTVRDEIPQPVASAPVPTTGSAMVMGRDYLDEGQVCVAPSGRTYVSGPSLSPSTGDGLSPAARYLKSIGADAPNAGTVEAQVGPVIQPVVLSLVGGAWVRPVLAGWGAYETGYGAAEVQDGKYLEGGLRMASGMGWVAAGLPLSSGLRAASLEDALAGPALSPVSAANEFRLPTGAMGDAAASRSAIGNTAGSPAFVPYRNGTAELNFNVETGQLGSTDTSSFRIASDQFVLPNGRVIIPSRTDPNGASQFIHGTFDASTGELSIGKVYTANRGLGIGTELTSRAVEQFGAENVTSISGELGADNLRIYNQALSKGAAPMEAAMQTPAAAIRARLGYGIITFDPVTGVITGTRP